MVLRSGGRGRFKVSEYPLITVMCLRETGIGISAGFCFPMSSAHVASHHIEIVRGFDIHTVGTTHERGEFQVESSRDGNPAFEKLIDSVL